MSIPSSKLTSGADVDAVGTHFVKELGSADAAISFLRNVIVSIQKDKSVGNKRTRTEGESLAISKSVQDSSTDPYVLYDGVDEMPITLIIQLPEDVSLISHVIGKNGNAIKSIINTTQCKVQVERPGARPQGDVYRHVFFSGKLMAVYSAYKLLSVKTDEMKIANGDSTRLVVPHEMVGHIIGKGGMLIKELQELTKALKIDVQADADMTKRLHAGVYGRTVTILGNLNARNHSIYLLLRQVRNISIISNEFTLTLIFFGYLNLTLEPHFPFILALPR